MVLSVNGYQEVIEINCDYTLMDKSFCQLTNIINTNESIIVKFADDNVKNNNITTINILHSNLNKLPIGIFTKFTKIITANFDACELNDIEPVNFLNANYLKNLDLHNNNIKVLVNQTFINAKRLIAIDLSWNQIETIESIAFLYLNHLQTLKLNFNQIKLLPSVLFNDLLNLQNLYLYSNELEIIDNNLFANNKKLQSIYLNYNNISELNPIAFMHLDKLLYFDISNNPFNKFEHIFLIDGQNLYLSNTNAYGLFIGEHVNFINATNNQITYIKLFNNNLTTLILENNNLKNISIIKNLLNLKILNLSQNKLITFDNSIFENFGNLEELHLSNTNLKFSDFHIFQNLNNLKVLDISENSLELIDFSFFEKLKQLKELYINGNNLTITNYHLQQINIIFSSSFEVLTIYDNNFDCCILSKLISILYNKNTNIILNDNPIDQLAFTSMDCTIECNFDNNLINQYDLWYHWPNNLSWLQWVYVIGSIVIIILILLCVLISFIRCCR